MAQADGTPKAPPEEDYRSSPWFVTPLVSSDPKILTSYLHELDEESPPSLFGVSGTYITADSWYLRAFAKAPFNSVEESYPMNKSKKYLKKAKNT